LTEVCGDCYVNILTTQFNLSSIRF